MAIPDKVWIAEDMDGQLFVANSREEAAVHGGGVLFERAAEQGEMDFSPKASSIDKERLEWLAKEYKDAIHKSRWGEKRFEHRVSEYSDGIVWMTPDGHKKVIGPDRLRQMERMGLDVKDVQRVIRVEHMRVWKELNDELQTFNNQEADDVPF